MMMTMMMMMMMMMIVIIIKIPIIITIKLIIYNKTQVKSLIGDKLFPVRQNNKKVDVHV